MPLQYPSGDYPITPNLLLGLWGMDDQVAENFINIDGSVLPISGGTMTGDVSWKDSNGNTTTTIAANGPIYAKYGMLVPASNGIPGDLDTISAQTAPLVHGAVSLLSQTTPLFITGEHEDETLLHLLSFYVDSHLDGGGNPSDNTLSIYLTWTDPSGGPINTIVGVIDGVDPNNRYLYITIPVLPLIGTPIVVTTVYAGTVHNKHFTYDIAVCKMHLPLNGYTDQFVVTQNTGEVIPTPVVTGSFTLGDILTLPSYNFWLSTDAISAASDRISINATASVGAYSALQIAIDGGPSTSANGITCDCSGLYEAGALRFLSTASPTSSGCYVYGVEGISSTQNTAIHAHVYGGYFFAGALGNGGLADDVTGLHLTALGGSNGYTGTGTAKAYGIDIDAVIADPSTGTAIGIWIEADTYGNCGVQAATRYAIKSDTAAPSIFAGLLACTTLDLSAVAPTVGSGHIALGGTVAATASVGGGQAVPATVLGYIIANVAGTPVKIPYFSA